MKLSNKGRYALQATFDLAFHGQGRAAQIKEISERQAIPARFLEQVFQDLKRARIVTSKRGPRGGYRLARAAEDIRVGDVIRAIEGPLALDAVEVRGSSQPTTGQRVTQEVLQELSGQVDACFDGVSIADLCSRGEALKLRQPPAGHVYAI